MKLSLNSEEHSAQVEEVVHRCLAAKSPEEAIALYDSYLPFFDSLPAKWWEKIKILLPKNSTKSNSLIIKLLAARASLISVSNAELLSFDPANYLSPESDDEVALLTVETAAIKFACSLHNHQNGNTEEAIRQAIEAIRLSDEVLDKQNSSSIARIRAAAIKAKTKLSQYMYKLLDVSDDTVKKAYEEAIMPERPDPWLQVGQAYVTQNYDLLPTATYFTVLIQSAHSELTDMNNLLLLAMISSKELSAEEVLAAIRQPDFCYHSKILDILKDKYAEIIVSNYPEECEKLRLKPQLAPLLAAELEKDNVKKWREARKIACTLPARVTSHRNVIVNSALWAFHARRGFEGAANLSYLPALQKAAIYYASDTIISSMLHPEFCSYYLLQLLRVQQQNPNALTSSALFDYLKNLGEKVNQASNLFSDKVPMQAGDLLILLQNFINNTNENSEKVKSCQVLLTKLLAKSQLTTEEIVDVLLTLTKNTLLDDWATHYLAALQQHCKQPSIAAIVLQRVKSTPDLAEKKQLLALLVNVEKNNTPTPLCDVAPTETKEAVELAQIITHFERALIELRQQFNVDQNPEEIIDCTLFKKEMLKQNRPFCRQLLFSACADHASSSDPVSKILFAEYILEAASKGTCPTVEDIDLAITYCAPYIENHPRIKNLSCHLSLFAAALKNEELPVVTTEEPAALVLSKHELLRVNTLGAEELNQAGRLDLSPLQWQRLLSRLERDGDRTLYLRFFSRWISEKPDLTEDELSLQITTVVERAFRKNQTSHEATLWQLEYCRLRLAQHKYGLYSAKAKSFVENTIERIAEDALRRLSLRPPLTQGQGTDTAHAYWILAQHALQKNNLTDARAFFFKASELSTHPELQFEVAQFLLKYTTIAQEPTKSFPLREMAQSVFSPRPKLGDRERAYQLLVAVVINSKDLDKKLDALQLLWSAFSNYTFNQHLRRFLSAQALVALMDLSAVSISQRVHNLTTAVIKIIHPQSEEGEKLHCALEEGQCVPRPEHSKLIARRFAKPLSQAAAQHTSTLFHQTQQNPCLVAVMAEMDSFKTQELSKNLQRSITLAVTGFDIDSDPTMTRHLLDLLEIPLKYAGKEVWAKAITPKIIDQATENPIAAVLYHLALLFKYDLDPNKTQPSFNRALTLCQQRQEEEDYPVLLFAEAVLHLSQGNLTKAKNQLQLLADPQKSSLEPGQLMSATQETLARQSRQEAHTSHFVLEPMSPLNVLLIHAHCRQRDKDEPKLSAARVALLEMSLVSNEYERPHLLLKVMALYQAAAQEDSSIWLEWVIIYDQYSNASNEEKAQYCKKILEPLTVPETEVKVRGLAQFYLSAIQSSKHGGTVQTTSFSEAVNCNQFLPLLIVAKMIAQEGRSILYGKLKNLKKEVFLSRSKAFWFYFEKMLKASSLDDADAYQLYHGLLRPIAKSAPINKLQPESNVLTSEQCARLISAVQRHSQGERTETKNKLAKLLRVLIIQPTSTPAKRADRLVALATEQHLASIELEPTYLKLLQDNLTIPEIETALKQALDNQASDIGRQRAIVNSVISGVLSPFAAEFSKKFKARIRQLNQVATFFASRDDKPIDPNEWCDVDSLLLADLVIPKEMHAQLIPANPEQVTLHRSLAKITRQLTTLEEEHTPGSEAVETIITASAQYLDESIAANLLYCRALFLESQLKPTTRKKTDEIIREKVKSLIGDTTGKAASPRHRPPSNSLVEQLTPHSRAMLKHQGDALLTQLSYRDDFTRDTQEAITRTAATAATAATAELIIVEERRQAIAYRTWMKKHSPTPTGWKTIIPLLEKYKDKDPVAAALYMRYLAATNQKLAEKPTEPGFAVLNYYDCQLQNENAVTAELITSITAYTKEDYDTPTRIIAFTLLAKAQKAQGNKSGARASLSQAIKLDKRDFELLLRWAKLAFEENLKTDFPDAEQKLRDIIEHSGMKAIQIKAFELLVQYCRPAESAMPKLPASLIPPMLNLAVTCQREKSHAVAMVSKMLQDFQVEEGCPIGLTLLNMLRNSNQQIHPQHALLLAQRFGAEIIAAINEEVDIRSTTAKQINTLGTIINAGRKMPALTAVLKNYGYHDLHARQESLENILLDQEAEFEHSNDCTQALLDPNKPPITGKQFLTLLKDGKISPKSSDEAQALHTRYDSVIIIAVAKDLDQQKLFTGRHSAREFLLGCTGIDQITKLSSATNEPIRRSQKLQLGWSEESPSDTPGVRARENGGYSNDFTLPVQRMIEREERKLNRTTGRP